MVLGDDIWSCGGQHVLMYYGLRSSNVNDVKDDNEASGSRSVTDSDT